MPRRLIVLVFAAGCGRVAFDPTSDGPAPQFRFRQPVVLRTSQLASDVTEPFPIFVRVGASERTIAPTPAELRFFAADGVTPLPFEIEAPQHGGTQFDAWVRVPSLPTGADLSLYAMWGDATLEGASNPTAVFPRPFVGVWHLADGTDSTATANHGQYTGTTIVDGVAGLARDLGGGYLTASGAPLASLAGTGTATWSAWVRMHSFPASPLVTSVISLPTAGGSGANDFRFGAAAGGGVGGELTLNPGAQTSFAFGGTIDLTWSQIALVLDVPNVYVYVNGRREYTGTVAGSQLQISTAERLLFGADCNGCGTGPPDSDMVDGVIDEVRIQEVARPAPWFAAEYAMLSGNLVEVGVVEPL